MAVGIYNTWPASAYAHDDTVLIKGRWRVICQESANKPYIFVIHEHNVQDYGRRFAPWNNGGHDLPEDKWKCAACGAKIPKLIQSYVQFFAL